MDFQELIEKIKRNTAAQEERNKKWRVDLGLPDPAPTELDLLLQKWKLELPSQEPEGEELPLPEPRGEELPLPEPRGEELPLPEPEGEDLLSPELEGKEVKSLPPPQPRPPPLRSSPASLCAVPRLLLLDTLPVSLDLPSLDLEPRSLQNRSQFSTGSPAPLLPDTKTSLRCSQTSRTLPLVIALLPLGDRTSLHWVPAADLCPLLQPPVPRLSLWSALTNRWVPLSPVRGPYLAGPGRGPIHPRVRPWKRAKMDICGLEGNRVPWTGRSDNSFPGLGGSRPSRKGTELRYTKSSPQMDHATLAALLEALDNRQEAEERMKEEREYQRSPVTCPRVVMHWLSLAQKMGLQMGEAIVTEQFYHVVGAETQSWIRRHNPHTLEAAVKLAEDFKDSLISANIGLLTAPLQRSS
ncbi:UNVERIFIED_CONTAM: hypothetical protein FKN15_055830 [Acipenser sinensis]